ncbi:MAG: sigma-70 family RNA polymerase sigma factor [Bacteroidaceae bacterium]|nr:sigma-70 family RNA polymerase sigma factor [Bacteroidaceae bacterium]
MNADSTTTRLTAEKFDELYRTYGRRAQGFFLRMTGYDHSLAEDLTQELFTRIWEHRSEYRSEDSFATWMYAIAYNLCKNEYRHRIVVETYAQEARSAFSEAAPFFDSLERDEQKRLLAQAVQNLPVGQREVFMLRYDEELSIEQVAVVCGIPVGTVKSRLFTALQTLRKQFKQTE